MLTEELNGWERSGRPRGSCRPRWSGPVGPVGPVGPLLDSAAMFVAVAIVRCLVWLVAMRFRMVERREQ